MLVHLLNSISIYSFLFGSLYLSAVIHLIANSFNGKCHATRIFSVLVNIEHTRPHKTLSLNARAKPLCQMIDLYSEIGIALTVPYWIAWEKFMGFVKRLMYAMYTMYFVFEHSFAMARTVWCPKVSQYVDPIQRLRNNDSTYIDWFCNELYTVFCKRKGQSNWNRVEPVFILSFN